ncbi:MAG: hypothetical protein Q4A28_01245 [Brachymonas sp.]|nr:hypothetical protein [Brachymonas sp.]
MFKKAQIWLAQNGCFPASSGLPLRCAHITQRDPKNAAHLCALCPYAVKTALKNLCALIPILPSPSASRGDFEQLLGRERQQKQACQFGGINGDSLNRQQACAALMTGGGFLATLNNAVKGC